MQDDVWDIRDKNRLFFYSLFFLCVSLPFQCFLPPSYGFGVLFLGWLLQSGWKAKMDKGYKWAFFAFGAFVVFATVLELIQSSAFQQGFRLMPLLLIPLFIGGGSISKEQFKLTLVGFAISCNLALLIDVLIGLGNVFAHLDNWDVVPAWNHLFYNKLSFLIPNQAHYFALYLTLAFFISLSQASNGFKEWKLRPVWTISSALHLIGLGLLAARAQLLAFAIVFVVFLLVLSYQTKKVNTIVCLFVVAAAILSTVVLVSPRTIQRIKEAKENIAFTDADKQPPTRLYIRKEAKSLIDQHPFFGAGIHEAYPKLWSRAKSEVSLLLKSTDYIQISKSDHPLRHELLSDLLMEAENEMILHEQDLFWSGRKDNTVLIQEENSTTGLYRISTRGNYRKRGGLQVFDGNQRILGIRDALSDPISSTHFFASSGGRLELREAPWVKNEIIIDDLWVFTYPDLHTNGHPVPPAIWTAAETYLHHLLSHNQFIDLLLRFGLIGFLLFMAGILSIIIDAIKKKKVLLLLLVGLLGISFLFEHMLARQAGIFFIPLFLFLLLKHEEPQV